MALQLKKAQRSKAYLKLGLAAPSGGGKTAGSLLIAYGLMKEAHAELSEAELWEKIAIIDTENGSGELYVNADIAHTKIGEYLAVTLRPPFTADKYIEAINLCEKNGVEVCIIDSSTHLWSGEGGLLEQQSNAAKRTNNTYTAWRDITPLHSQFVSRMLQTPMHVIATMRSKQEYSIDKDANGKSSVTKLGLEPEQRKGMEYEFTVFFDISADHSAFGSKDRTSIFDQQTFKINSEVGAKLMRWLKGATDKQIEVLAETPSAQPSAPAVSAPDVKAGIKPEIVKLVKELGGMEVAEVKAIWEKYVPERSAWGRLTDVGTLESLHSELLDFSNIKTEKEIA